MYPKWLILDTVTEDETGEPGEPAAEGERRRRDRRGGADRRTHDAPPPDGIEKRKGERRKGQRRKAKDSREP
jgi:hypothetical protein